MRYPTHSACGLAGFELSWLGRANLHCGWLALPPLLQNPFMIATKTVSSEVYVFDYTKHETKPAPGKRASASEGCCLPQLFFCVWC
jgi:hypothetical protein